MNVELISLIANLVLSGGLIVTVVTLKSQRNKAAAEAKRVELDNEEKTLDMQVKYIVEPLKREINGLRRDIKKLQKALDCISDCPHALDCPVRNKLQSAAEGEQAVGDKE